jgi:hypothetical protein
MYCIVECIVQGKQARVKNADLRHPSSMCLDTYEHTVANLADTTLGEELAGS